MKFILNQLKIKSTFLVVLSIITLSSNAQEKPFPIFDYGTETVNSDEFLRVFNKNRRSENPITQKEIEEYLVLYTRFKLKVSEAYARKMDTIPTFINELAGYRRQLALPYLTDKEVNNKLVRQAFERSQKEVHASHLLVNCNSDAKAVDTLIAYNKIMGYRKRVVEDGEDFNEMAFKYSDDPSSKENKGSLGYFTAFQMIYPFENAAYNLDVGKISMPIRTQFGYHLVYVHDKRPSLGDIQASHIMIKFNNESEVDSAKRRIDGVYAKLQDGADWKTMVTEFSEDFGTNNKGGQLNWFNRTSSNIPTAFKDAAYELKTNGDYSKPLKTKYGWHIIKRLDMKPLPTFEESESSLKRKVERDSRSELNKEVVLKRIKKENKYQEVNGLQAVVNNFDASIKTGKYVVPDSTAGAVLFKIDGKDFTDKDFYAYAATNQTPSNKSVENTVNDLYEKYVNQSNLDYEEQILESKYPEFRNIMQEYKDGILLFELTDKEVWSKAVNDSAGLAAFYEANKANYMWKERANATIFSCKDEKTAKKAKKCLNKGEAISSVAQSLNEKDALAVSTETKKFEKGTNSLLDKIDWKEGTYPLDSENDRVKFVVISEIIAPTSKALDENLGLATSDYQNYLEDKWIEELKLKYPINIYDNNVKKLYQ
jgi:peptidyl-prolyl cis-trans isomerase SurA